jgi:hypothetical protein
MSDSEWTKEDQKWAKEVLTCRQIVSEIVKFGVNEEQKLKIIELLALELENRETSVAIVNVTKGVQETGSSTNTKGRILT